MLTNIERKLLETGYDGLTTQEKNQLISQLANESDTMYYDVSLKNIVDHHKSLKLEILSDKSRETIANGFVSTNGHTYRTNADDRENMIGKAVQLLFKPDILIVKWKTEDIGYIDHSREEWINNVFLEALSFKELTLFKYDTLRTQVENATTDSNILNINWEG